MTLSLDAVQRFFESGFPGALVALCLGVVALILGGMVVLLPWVVWRLGRDVRAIRRAVENRRR
jgi:hypothetical protein